MIASAGLSLGANPRKPFVKAYILVLVRTPTDWDWDTEAAVGGSCICAVSHSPLSGAATIAGPLREAIIFNHSSQKGIIRQDGSSNSRKPRSMKICLRARQQHCKRHHRYAGPMFVSPGSLCAGIGRADKS